MYAQDVAVTVFLLFFSDFFCFFRLGNYADSDYKDEENSNNKINKKDSNLSSTPDIQKTAFAAIPTAQTNISMPELPANSNNSTVSPSRHYGTTKTIKAT